MPEHVIGPRAAPLGYATTPNGIIVPADLMLKSLNSEMALYKAQRRAQRQAAVGAFFSDWTRLTGFNQAGAMEKPSDEVNFQFLRDTYSHSAIDQIIINTRIHQIRQVSQRCRDPQKHAGFRIVHKDHDSPDFVETPELRQMCEFIEDIILHPTEHIHPNGVKDVFTISTREELTIDRKVAVVQRDHRGRPIRYHLVDGATILGILRVLYPWLVNNAREYGIRFNPKDPDSVQDALNQAGEEISSITGIPKEQLAYVQEIDSKIMAGWTADQLAIDITQPSTWTNRLPYGQGSILQQSIDLTASWVNAWQYNQNLFRTNYPERLVAIKGEWDPNAMEAMKRKVFSEAGPASWERLLLMNGDDDFEVTTYNLRDTPKDMLYGELLRIIVILKTAAYRMDPSTIGFSHDAGSGTSLFGSGDREEQLAMAQEEGFHGLLQNLANWFTHFIVQPWHEDLIMIFDGLKQEQEQERVELSTKAVASYLPLNDALAKENKDPLPPLNGVDVGRYPLPLALAALGAKNEPPEGPQSDSKGAGGTNAAKSPKNVPRGRTRAQGDDNEPTKKSLAKSLLIEVVHS